MRLALHRFPAAGSPRGAVLAVHAMMADASYLARFCAFAAARGLECFALDLRGHGASVPPSPRRDQWTFDDYVRHDLPAALGAVASATGRPIDRLGYLGHSLGGLAALAAFATGAAPPPARAVLVAVSPWLGVGPRRFRRRLVAEALAALARPRGYFPARAVRLGTVDEPAAYLRQLVGWVRARRWIASDGTDYLAGLGKLRAPALFVTGADDDWCRPEDVRLVAARLGGPVSHRLAQGGHFAFFTHAQPGLWHDVIAFLDSGPG